MDTMEVLTSTINLLESTEVQIVLLLLAVILGILFLLEKLAIKTVVIAAVGIALFIGAPSLVHFITDYF